MIKGNAFILILVTTMFVSCKFYRNGGANKQNASLSDATGDIGGNIGLGILQDGNKKGNITSKVALAQVAEYANSELILDDPDSSVSKYDQEKIADKLTEEDVDKLKAFFEKTITYQGKLNSIYNKYTGSYNTIATYSGCADYSIGCFSNGPSARRSQALINLENNKLDEEYSKLNKMLEQAATGYDASTLNNAININKYKEVIKKAKEAENKIEKENDYTETKKADTEKKKRNLDNLKTVKDVLTISKKTIESASVAYAHAFAAMASSLSSAEFKKAVNEFKDTAEKYANGDRGDHAVDVIVGAIAGMAFDNENGFKRAKMFANKATDEGGETK